MGYLNGNEFVMDHPAFPNRQVLDCRARLTWLASRSLLLFLRIIVWQSQVGLVPICPYHVYYYFNVNNSIPFRLGSQMSVLP